MGTFGERSQAKLAGGQVAAVHVDLRGLHRPCPAPFATIQTYENAVCAPGHRGDASPNDRRVTC
jgi:hypothetical protein